MKLKIKMSCLPGYATSTGQKARPMIIGLSLARIKLDTYANADDDVMIWDIECGYRDYDRIVKNIMKFDVCIRNILMNKGLLKAAQISQQDLDALKELTKKSTKIEIIKAATYQEMIDGQKTWWDNIKATFKKVVDVK